MERRATNSGGHFPNAGLGATLCWRSHRDLWSVEYAHAATCGRLGKSVCGAQPSATPEQTVYGMPVARTAVWDNTHGTSLTRATAPSEFPRRSPYVVRPLRAFIAWTRKALHARGFSSWSVPGSNR